MGKEKHAYLRKDGRFTRANFMGPGTDLIPRLKRGDQGLTFMDEVSKLHDIEYGLAQGSCRTKECVKKKTREADRRMVKYAKKAYKEKKDHWFNIAQGGGLIRGKMLLEDIGILDPARFTGKHTAKYLKGSSERDISEGEYLHAQRRKILKSGPLADYDASVKEYELE